MILGLNGFRETSPQRLLRGSGILVRNGNISQLLSTGLAAAMTYANTWTGPNGVLMHPGVVGATRGGIGVDPKITMTQITLDDLRVPLMGLDVIDSAMPEFQINPAEMADVETLKMALGSATQAAPSTSGYIALQPNLVVALSDYLGNLMFCTSTTEDGQDKPLIVVLHNPICTTPAALKTASKDITVPTITMRGSQPGNLATTIPITYYVPESVGSGS